MTAKKTMILQNASGALYRSLWSIALKGLWTCHKSDYGMRE